ncbi:1-deoxy-D-xylulose-5-phosphate synthase [Actinomycetospora sp. NBRC 106378]|uniref:1-deoxy-D-xylulose-5-phosphate synthase n=1 Tax=Actinomycetospora sp. NBRC 106378 TaxID=3032208 RepID=UPI0024A000E7|nr:1-deoxy-D-xylulose-5-phosphate synthase [Actinomycetospora sp. NBRC 106378]GLZ54606.1 1-deoxy-D-xylulose-5-phosphate synthase [Actinomycetospora sp. NBRC 106378]
MSLLQRVRTPADLRALDAGEVDALAAEIRGFLIDAVCRTGGHLGPNLGVVELTLALHRVFDSPRDALLFDTGHQSYVHKIVTGRSGEFDGLRQGGGLSGYPSRAESEHDLVENSHASTALSWADGLAKADQLLGRDRSVVAVVGDGALTGGMCWEALNNIAGSDRPVVIVVNDNGRSYAPTIGGLSERLSTLRLAPRYEDVLEHGKKALRRIPVVGNTLYSAVHAAKAGVKDAFSPQALFSDLGLKYLGPVDGHDTAAMETALTAARDFGGPVIVHAVTSKGRGFASAEQDLAEQMHAVGVLDPDTGLPVGPKPREWTSVFTETMLELGRERADVVAITAAMPGPTGLAAFGEVYPERLFDVGIAEQHALTSAAGLAHGGLHPVVAIYSTFLNRAFDQLLMDVALHREPVTVVLDRAGVTGSDGASHNGMWDLSVMGIVPGLRVASPRDAVSLREELREAVDVADGPTALRWSKGAVPSEVPALRRIGGASGPGAVDVLAEPGRLSRAAPRPTAIERLERADDEPPQVPDVLLVCVGVFGQLGVEAADRLTAQGIGVTVVDPRWLQPVPPALLDLAASHRLVVTVEDGGRHGGFGSALADALSEAGTDVPVRRIALAQEFLVHDSRGALLAAAGLTDQDVARRVTEWVAASRGDAETSSLARDEKSAS